ncbi:MAG: DUF881 domain-containing protein [Hyphomonadaceae bacterium]|nr:DUF881 domain-containing protein [Clostridia bacterium]
MKNIKFQIAIGLICLILGFVIPLQYRSVVKINKQSSIQEQRVSVLQDELKKLQEKYDKSYTQILQYEKDLNAIRQTTSESSDYAKTLLDQLKRAEVLAGMTELEGVGVQLTLNDSKLKNPGTVDENAFILHDQDVMMILNELRAAGAEAISISDERVLATTEIRCVGPTVSINNNKYAPPFIINAIGEADRLEASINLRGGVKDLLEKYGVEVTVKKMAKVVVPRYKGAVTLKYATTVTKKEEVKP